MRLRRQVAPTLTLAIQRYLAEVSPLKKGAVSEQSLARAWLATRLAGRPVDRIRNTDLIALRDQWAGQYKPATIVRRLAFLSHVFTVLRKDWGWPELANPVQLVRRPTVDDARDRRIFQHIRLRGVSESECPRSELDWILASTESAELPTIVTLAVESTMRRGEICGIHREHVDLRGGVVRLPDTKNGTSREVPLTPWANETLRQYLANRPLKGRIFSMTAGAVTRAFIRARQRARKAYEALCAKYGRRPQAGFFQNLRLHDLRHEATSVLAPLLQLHEMAKISGHKDTRMLLRYYHPDGRELARKIARSPLGKQQSTRIRSIREGGGGRLLPQRPPGKRRLPCGQALILGSAGQVAPGDLGQGVLEQADAHRAEVSAPQVGGGIPGTNKAPVLGDDWAAVGPLIHPIDAAAGDRLPHADSPFNSVSAPVQGQQTRVIPHRAKPGGAAGAIGDETMGMGGED